MTPTFPRWPNASGITGKTRTPGGGGHQTTCFLLPHLPHPVQLIHATLISSGDPGFQLRAWSRNFGPAPCGKVRKYMHALHSLVRELTGVIFVCILGGSSHKCGWSNPSPERPRGQLKPSSSGDRIQAL